jgi:hypothetical protein
MPSPIYENMVNLVNYECYDAERRTFQSKIFGYGRIYYSNSIIITNFALTLIPNC